ncbi:MAG TPA: hypothetical protein VJL29_06740 [Thermoguttaceae bacterium]|nr:hypothetical protein [Thermoguttaceae bacterium]
MPSSSRFSAVDQVPKYRRHKPSGRAVVTIGGRDHYLGKWNTQASRCEYNRLIGQWLASGRVAPSDGVGPSVAEILAAYLRFAKGYYRKNGEPTSELSEYRQTIRLVRQIYGMTPAKDFGPLALKALRERMIAAGWCRRVVNQRIGRVKRIFKWAVSEELVPPSVNHGLQAVAGLRRGRTTARETEPVKPVPDHLVEATLPHLPAVVADMVRLQRLTGCRPMEVCILRPCDVDMSGDVWIYRPESHKTEHHGRDRLICIGPKGQEILRPYLLRGKTDYCFSPVDSERRRREAQ